MSKPNLTPAERLKLVEELVREVANILDADAKPLTIRERLRCADEAVRALEALRGMEVTPGHCYDGETFGTDTSLIEGFDAALLTLRNGGDDE